jgi:hypothetical protein
MEAKAMQMCHGSSDGGFGIQNSSQFLCSSKASQEVPTMLYVVQTAKDVETAARDLEEAMKRNKFGVLHVHDLQKRLR